MESDLWLELSAFKLKILNDVKVRTIIITEVHEYLLTVLMLFNFKL